MSAGVTMAPVLKIGRGKIQAHVYFEPLTEWWIGLHWSDEALESGWRVFRLYVAPIPTVYVILRVFRPLA